jgi:putative oxidoreductase
MPIDIAEAESYGLSYLTWWVVTYGEFLAGIGLLVGGILNRMWMYDMPDWIGDMVTRFSGITICCIMTGVIWIGDPESILDVLFYDNLHVLLWVGGLYFALRGNRV